MHTSSSSFRSSSSHGSRPLEQLEPRWLMAAPVIADIDDATLPGGKSLIVPLTATDDDGGRITYTITSSNADVKARLHTGNPHLKLTVQGFGTMVFELLRDVAPNTVDHIAGMAQAGFYDGLTFHRVIDKFMIQGGDPLGTGTGGPEYQIDDEYHRDAIFTGRGQLAMAKSGDDTNGSQFFITDGSPRHLDFNHTIFGQLVRGWGVLKDISEVPVGANDKPTTPVVITKAELIDNKTDAVVTLTSSKAANSTITVVATDEDGNTHERTFAATATATDTVPTGTVNNRPFMLPIGTHYSDVNKKITIPIKALDLEGNNYFVWGTLLSEGFKNANVEGTNLIVEPVDNFKGALKVSVGVSPQAVSQFNPIDCGSNWDCQTIVIVVGDEPITAAPAGVAASAGQAATVTVATFKDPDPAATAAQYSAQIHWGDGKKSTGTVTAGAGGEFIVTGSHTFALQGEYPLRVTITGTGGATAQVLAKALVGDGTPLVNAGPSASVKEGARLTRRGSSAGAGSWTGTVDYGDGSDAQPLDLVGENFTLSHDYDDDGTYTVTVTLTDGLDVITDAFTVKVTQVGPAASLGGDAGGVRGQQRTLTLDATDRSSEDEAAGFKYEINWDDGSPIEKTTRGVTAASHAFAAAGTYDVRVRALDRDGVAGAWKTRRITITAAQLQTDPWNSKRQALVVGGTPGADKISVTPASGGKVKVTIGSAVIGGFAPTGRIIVIGQDGNDSIVIDPSIARDAELRGDGGNDKLKAGGGNDVLLGGAGRDALAGNAGRDLLIGGSGADTLVAGAVDDLLIAATSGYDASTAGLRRIMLEWTSAANYATRIDHLRNGGGLLGTVRLSTTKVRGDADADILTGNAGTDAFWLNTKAVKDQATDRATSESRVGTVV